MMRMRGVRHLRRFLALSGADQWRLFRAWLALAMTDVELRILGYRRLVRRIERLGDTRQLLPGDIERARRSACWLTLASRRHIVRAHCLHRSLALHTELRRAGLPSELRIGVRKEDGVLQAHAWVELGGHIINDSAASVRAFTQFTDIGESSYATIYNRFDPVATTCAARLEER